MSHPTPAQIITRADGPHLIVQALGDEVVVFDRNKNKAHLLNPVAASIWRAAEGGCRIDAVTHLAGGESKERNLELARLAIFELERAGLVVSDRPVPARRRMLKRLGQVVAAPMVISILAPPPAAAASNVPDGAICNPIAEDTCLTDGRSCEDRDGPSGEPARCCWFDVGRVSQKLNGAPCGGNLECCSLVCDNFFNKCVGN